MIEDQGTPAAQPAADDRQRPAVMGLYVVFIIALIGQIVPSAGVQFVCAGLILVLLGVNGWMRKRAAAGSLMHDHGTYISRTIWIWSAIMGACMVAAGYYASTKYSYEEFLEIAQALSRQDISDPAVQNFAAIGFWSAMPGVLYLCLRIARAVWHLQRRTILPNPRAWF